MNAIELIRDDHRRLTSLFRDFAGATDPNEKQQIAEDAFIELKVHTQIEEQVFYPAVREKSDDRNRGLVDESFTEHGHIDQLISELKVMRPEDEQYDRKFNELMREAERHIQGEETQLLPEAEQRLSDDLDRLGDQMKRLKSQLAEAA